MRKLTTLVTSVAFVTAMASSPVTAAVTVLDTVTPDDASGVTLAAMEAQCDAKAAAHGSNWSGELDEGSITPSYVSGPTEVGTHSIEDAIGDPVGAGTFTPAHTEIEGDPYRNGGSVNMFGDAVAVGGHYSASTYDFEGEFSSTYAYAFNCTMKENVYIPLQGYYIVEPEDQGNEEASQNSCNAFTANGPTWVHWGQDHAQCDFVKTGGDEYVDEDRPDEAGTPVNQTQTDLLLAHEDAGEGFFTDETLAIGMVVVCISPSSTGKKLPGEWRAQNGYDGGSSVQGEPGCNTGWYNGGAMDGVSNLNDGSHNWVTVPLA